MKEIFYNSAMAILNSNLDLNANYDFNQVLKSNIVYSSIHLHHLEISSVASYICR